MSSPSSLHASEVRKETKSNQKQKNKKTKRNKEGTYSINMYESPSLFLLLPLLLLLTSLLFCCFYEKRKKRWKRKRKSNLNSHPQTLKPALAEINHKQLSLRRTDKVRLTDVFMNNPQFSKSPQHHTLFIFCGKVLGITQGGSNPIPAPLTQGAMPH